MMKALIIDDEIRSQSILKNMLENEMQQTFNELVSAQNVADAVFLCNSFKPNVIFLDIELGQETGFDFLEKVSYKNFKIIFTTAHENYALQAFRVNASDYLLKPFSVEDLKLAVVKATQQQSYSQMGFEIQYLIDYIKGNKAKLALPTSEGFKFINFSDIIQCESQGNYTHFHLKNQKNIVVAKTLKIYENLLADEGFCRIHASHLVNLKEVKEYIKGDGGSVVMSNDSKIEVSRSKKDNFLALFKQ